MGPYFIALTSLIEDLRASTGGPVLLLLHSYGAPLTNFFLNTKVTKILHSNKKNICAIKRICFGVNFFLNTKVRDTPIIAPGACITLSKKRGGGGILINICV